MKFDGHSILRQRLATAAMALTLAATLGACGKKERPESIPALPMQTNLAEPVASQPQPGLTPDQRLARVVELLNANDEATARVELAELLREDPGRREARTLRQSVQGDPRAMVPRGSFAYVVKPGDTYITIARTFLGDSYKFYALARLNGIAANVLKAGDTLQIPGRYRDPEADRQRAARARGRQGGRTAAPGATAVRPVAPVSAANPGRAQQLRRAGLESMSGGRINQAVSRLEQALRFDPGNEAIAADLARARRIQATVRQRD